MPVNPDVGCFCDLLDCGVFPKFDNPVVAPFVMNEWRVRFARRKHVDNGGQFLEFQCNGLRDILGFRPRRRNAHRHELADISQLLCRQDRLGGTLEALHGRGRNDRIDAVKMLGREDDVTVFFGDLDLDQPGVRDRASHKCNLLHSVEPDVPDILPAPPEETIVLLPQDRSTHPRSG
jgi:hypothetical protein